jgi:hypothetical protein
MLVCVAGAALLLALAAPAAAVKEKDHKAGRWR